MPIPSKWGYELFDRQPHGVISMHTRSNTYLPSLLPSLGPIAEGDRDSLHIPLLSLIQGIETTPDFEPTIANLLPGQIEQIVIEICEVTDWDYGEVWMPSANSKVLELSQVWHVAADTVDEMSLEQFRLCSEGCVVSPGEGLPGRVWSSAQSEWIADATAQSESYWLRNQIAKAFNLSAGFGVPIIVTDRALPTLGDRVQAVVVFFKLGT
jgi:hypothetical protein